MSVRNLRKLGPTPPRGSIDDIDRGILTAIQEDCKTPLTRIGELVGLSAPSVIDRIRKLEEAGVIRGYHAVLAPLRLGLDLMAFVGVAIDSPRMKPSSSIVGTRPLALSARNSGVFVGSERGSQSLCS